MNPLDPSKPEAFDRVRVSPALDEALRAGNPWWRGLRRPWVPAFRRTLFPLLLRKLRSGPAPIVMVRGARQVGKTVLQQQVIEHLLDEERVDPRRILRVPLDELERFRDLPDPILAIARWYESHVLGTTLNEAARRGESAYLFFDELQSLSSWAPQLKHLVDLHAGRVAVSGSGALGIQGGQDSLAGRLDVLDLGVLSLREIAEVAFGVTLEPWLHPGALSSLRDPDFWRGLPGFADQQSDVRDRAFERFAQRGGYPIAQTRFDLEWGVVAEQLADVVVRRAIDHDLCSGEVESQRDEALLEEALRSACRHAGRAPSSSSLAEEIQAVRGAQVGDRRVQSCLRLLDEALLIRLIAPLDIRYKKQIHPSKICLVDHTVRAAWLQEPESLVPQALAGSTHLADLGEHLAQSAVGTFLKGVARLDLAWLPERPGEPEVDFVMTIGDARIPIEVKYRSRIDPTRDLAGLEHFLDKKAYGAPFGLLITRDESVVVRDPRIVPISLRSLLMMR